MVLTSVIGILVGIKLGCSVSEKAMKLASFGIFMAFGLEKIFKSIYFQSLDKTVIAIGLIVLTWILVLRVKKFLKEIKEKCVIFNTKGNYN